MQYGNTRDVCKFLFWSIHRKISWICRGFVNLSMCIFLFMCLIEALYYAEWLAQLVPQHHFMTRRHRERARCQYICTTHTTHKQFFDRARWSRRFQGSNGSIWCNRGACTGNTRCSSESRKICTWLVLNELWLLANLSQETKKTSMLDRFSKMFEAKEVGHFRPSVFSVI
jgi:hypothetical protein